MTSILKKHMPPSYLSTARMVGYCLLLDDDVENWHGLTVVLSARLSEKQRGLMAWATLRSLPPETAVEVATAALPERVGMPFHSSMDPTSDAAFWAAEATPEELDAYAVAIFNEMSAAKKRAFFDFVGRAAA